MASEETGRGEKQAAEVWGLRIALEKLAGGKERSPDVAVPPSSEAQDAVQNLFNRKSEYVPDTGDAIEVIRGVVEYTELVRKTALKEGKEPEEE